MNKLDTGYLRPVSVFREDVDHQLFVLFCPRSVPSIQLDDRLDIILDVLHLSFLIVYRNRTESEGLQNDLDIYLGLADDTYAQIGELRPDELFHKRQDFLAG